MKPLRCVAIVGVGLIGGSIGLALRRRKLAARVVGAGSRPATLAAALHTGAITEIAADVASAVADAELVIVCAPVDHIVEQVRAIARACPAGTLITDAGSTKQQIVDELERYATSDATWPAEVAFVGSHPLAGNEKKGPQHASATLFEQRTVVVTPTSKSKPTNVSRLHEFWSALGAKVLEMSAAEHDRAVALTSHLPHLAAAAIAGTTPEQFLNLTAGGWLDTTRIAAGDPSLWRQIMLANRGNLLPALDALLTQLAAWRQALDTQDGVELERLLTEAKRIRDSAGS